MSRINLMASASCLNCSQYFTCADDRKSAAWSCVSFSPLSGAHCDDLLTQAQAYLDDTHEQFNPAEKDDPAAVGEFEAMISRAVSDNRLVPLDLRVDDSDIPEAANYYEWIYGRLGINFRPFSRQMWIALKLFGEMCPNPKCSDPSWVNDIESVPVDFNPVGFPDKITLLEYGVCPKCGARRSQLHRKGSLNVYQELNLCAGQRSGKSIQTGGLVSYPIHKLLKTNRPAEYYGLASSTTLTCTFTGLQFKRAYALLWTPIRDTILDSPWFREYHNVLKHYQNIHGEELLSIKDTFINWRRSRLLASPSAPNVGTLRGDTRALGGIDELGFFRFGAGAEDYITISADEIYASLANSLATVRGAASKLLRSGEDNVMQGIMFNLSSPSSVFDKIMQLVRASQGSRTLLGIRLPTWEINPDMPREALQSYYDTDPVKAERDFGANPPLGSAPFFEDKHALANLFTGGANSVTYEAIERTNPKFGGLERAAKLIVTKPLAKQPPSLLTLDAGVTNNSFALAISFPVADPNVKALPGVRLTNKLRREIDKHPAINKDVAGEDLRVVVQALIEIIPPKTGKISFSKVFNSVIVPLIKAYNVTAVVTDRWQNILMLDTLRDEHSVHTVQYSLKRRDFDTVKSYLEGGMVQLPRLDCVHFDRVDSFDHAGYPYCFEGRPVDHLALQLLTVRDNGRTIDKGQHMTDDLFRSVALATYFLRNIAFVTEHLSGHSKSSGRGGGLVASAGDVATQGVVSLTGNSLAGLAAGGGLVSSSGDVSNTFARTRR